MLKKWQDLSMAQNEDREKKKKKRRRSQGTL